MSDNVPLKKLYIYVIIMVLVQPIIHAAQEIEQLKAKLRGKVISINKDPISSARIELKRDETEKVFLYMTNEKGEFSSDAIPPGKYRLKVESRGYENYEGKLQLNPDVIKELDIVLAIEQTLEQKLKDEARFNFEEGLDFIEDNKIDEAIQKFQKAIELRPDFAEAYENLGILLFQRQEDVRAEEALVKALELKPQEERVKKILTEIYYEKARKLIQEDKSNEALGKLERAYNFNPKHAYVNYLLGYLYFNLQMKNEATKHFEAFLSLEPDSPNAEKVKDVLKRLKK